MTVARKYWRLIGKTLWWLCAVVAGILVIVVTINGFDQDLAPDTEALLAAPPNPYRAEENLYLALMGMAAPPGASPIAVGQARAEDYERTLQVVLKDPQQANAGVEKVDPKRLLFKGKIDFCRPRSASCWTDIASHQTEVRTLTDDNRELYQRYLKLKETPGYYETATPGMYAPSAFPPSELRALFLANFALSAKHGTAVDQAAALADLDGDLRVWRTMLVGEGTLVSKMVAVANIQGDYLMLADMIADSSVDLRPQWPQLERLLKPFDAADWKIGKSYGYEFRAMVSLWKQLNPDDAWSSTHRQETSPEAADWWQRMGRHAGLHFFQNNATENLHAQSLLWHLKVADATPEGRTTVLDEYSRWNRENFDFGIRYAYNPIGRILVGIAAPAYETYPLRALDAAAVQRLAGLGYEIRRQEIASSQIPTFIQQHPDLASHPANGKAFSWDADKRTIAITPVAQEPKDRRFSIPIWQGVQ